MTLGLPVDAFFDATPKLYLMVTDAAIGLRQRDDERAIHGAWLGAILGRAKKIPSFEKLVPRRHHDDDPEIRAAEQRAEMAAMRVVMEERGQGRTWAEWRERFPS